MSTGSNGNTPGSSPPAEVSASYIDFNSLVPVSTLPAELHMSKCLATENKVCYRLVSIQTERDISGVIRILLGVANVLMQETGLTLEDLSVLPKEGSPQTEKTGHGLLSAVPDKDNEIPS